MKELRKWKQHTVYPVYWECQEEIVIEALNLGADRYFNKFGKTETVYNEFHLAQTFISENNVELCNRSDAIVEKFTELSTETNRIAEIITTVIMRILFKTFTQLTSLRFT